MERRPQQLSSRKYRIERYLTEGGMGAIYLGKKLGPVGFEKEVVLKQLLPEFTARPEFRDLFFREAKISATLDHANIVHTFDLVESDGALFIVMEYVRGADLRTIQRRARIRRMELSPAAALHIGLEVLAGLGYAHGRTAPDGKPLGIIHRDVSPSNVLCSWQGEVKLSDFGIAKVSTQSSVFYRVRGKVGYMSPEQAMNEVLDARSDLYSAAVCLWESLTGERLFVGDLSTPPEEIYGQPIPRLSDKKRGLPVALDAVMQKALAPVADARFQTAGELAEALRNVAHRNGLVLSAPQLARHLGDILGANPDRWLFEETEVPLAGNTEELPLPPALPPPAGKPAALEGRELESSQAYIIDEADLATAGDIDSVALHGEDSGLEDPTVAGGRPAPAEATEKIARPTRRERTPTDLFRIVPEAPARAAPGAPFGRPAAAGAPAALPRPSAAGGPRAVQPFMPAPQAAPRASQRPTPGTQRAIPLREDEEEPTTLMRDALRPETSLDKPRASPFGMGGASVSLPSLPRPGGGPPPGVPGAARPAALSAPAPLLAAPRPLGSAAPPSLAETPVGPTLPRAPTVAPAATAAPASLSAPPSFSFENPTPPPAAAPVSFAHANKRAEPRAGKRHRATLRLDRGSRPSAAAGGPPAWAAALVLLGAGLVGAGAARVATAGDVASATAVAPAPRP